MNQKLVGIFFSSDTGNTEKSAKIIQKKIGKKSADIFDIADCLKEDIENYDKLIFGIPTWYYGEPQCDWDAFIPTLKNINFSRKTVAIFGCGDQEDYSEYFCDAMSILYKITINNGAKLIGEWSTAGYHFDTSKSIIHTDKFVGLAIDEDRQPEMTLARIHTWTDQICNEMNISSIKTRSF